MFCCTAKLNPLNLQVFPVFDEPVMPLGSRYADPARGTPTPTRQAGIAGALPKKSAQATIENSPPIYQWGSAQAAMAVRETDG
jgi:hypothetical protein